MKKTSETHVLVTGTSRNAGTIKDPLEGIAYLSLDLSDPESIGTLIKEAGNVDILINNAGISQIGPTEEIPMEEIRDFFQVNLFGQIALIQGVLPYMRSQKWGRIVNVGSMAGRTPVPFSTIYGSSKAALETFSLGLRNELAAFGISVSYLYFTAASTGITQTNYIKNSSPYYELASQVKKIRDLSIEEGEAPVSVARVAFKAGTAKKPKTFYKATKKGRLVAFLLRLIPENRYDRMIRRTFHL